MQTLVQQTHSEKIAQDRGTIYGFQTKNSKMRHNFDATEKSPPSRGKFTPYSVSVSG